jgi:SAM-dependent methyltransferase
MLPELYHAHHSRHNEDLPFWLNLAARQGGPVVELGCGTGRVLIPLANAGYNMVGIDHDPAMLQFLRHNLQPELVPVPLLILADISQFTLSRQFPLIILPCNTFSTLSEKSRRGCLSCVRQYIQLGGLFAASLPNPAVLQQLPDQGDTELEDEFLHPTTGAPVQVSSAWQRIGETFTVTWIYDQMSPDGQVKRIEVEARHYLKSVEGYVGEIQRAGMKTCAMYGDFDQSPYTIDSPNLILLAEAVY